MPTFTLAQRNLDLDAHNARQLAQFARETGEHLIRPIRGATPAGHERRLRGIPVQTKGVGGTMPGTAPETCLT